LSLLFFGAVILKMQKTALNKYGYLWVTAALFLGSMFGHWLFAWYAYQNEAKAHGEPPEVKEYVTETLRDTFENWQSEFLQLIWQVAGLAFLFYVGSPQSKEGDERKEEKLDAVLRLLNEKEAEKIINTLDKKYSRTK
jgi:hypothetical protein